MNNREAMKISGNAAIWTAGVAIVVLALLKRITMLLFARRVKGPFPWEGWAAMWRVAVTAALTFAALATWAVQFPPT